MKLNVFLALQQKVLWVFFENCVVFWLFQAESFSFGVWWIRANLQQLRLCWFYRHHKPIVFFVFCKLHFVLLAKNRLKMMLFLFEKLTQSLANKSESNDFQKKLYEKKLRISQSIYSRTHFQWNIFHSREGVASTPSVKATLGTRTTLKKRVRT